MIGLCARAGRSLALITAKTAGGTHTSFPPNVLRVTSSGLSGFEGGFEASMANEYNAELSLPYSRFFCRRRGFLSCKFEISDLLDSALGLLSYCPLP